jgi:hypothetical protein
LEIGYCTNVHAGVDLEATQANLSKYAARVKQLVSPNDPMGIGLWLAAPAAQELLDSNQTTHFRDWLATQGLVPFTLNGFPYGNFHNEVVKHDVYKPTWHDLDRLQYTKNLATILDAILPAEKTGSISTLPIAWGKQSLTTAQWDSTVRQLLELADFLHELKQTTDRTIHVCIEPEPGCALDVAADMIDLFQNRLLPLGSEDKILHHIRVCHDVCHSAVMFESQTDVLRQYQELGIQVGKIQISSAVQVDFAQLAASDRTAAFEQLASFNEPRYLHQTCIRESNQTIHFHQDLSVALETVTDPQSLESTWSVHFHVPIFLESLGLLTTSQKDILECMEVCKSMPNLEHFEVETYAWNVLPKHLQQSDLAQGIADELLWFRNLISPDKS